MSILDDILKMVDDSADLDDAEKKVVRTSCKEAWDMEVGGAE